MKLKESWDFIKETIPSKFRKIGKIAFFLLYGVVFFCSGMKYENSRIQNKNEITIDNAGINTNNIDNDNHTESVHNIDVSYDRDIKIDLKESYVKSATDVKFNLNQWEYNKKMLDLNEYNKTGWICPKNLDRYGFKELEIWYKKKILPDKKIKYRFELMLSEKVDNYKPSLGFLYNNEEKEKYRIYLPGVDPNYIEFSDPVETEETRSEKLTRCVDTKKEITNEVFFDTNSENLIIKNNMEYFPVIEGADERNKAISDSATFTSNFLWTDPMGIGSEKSIGFSVFDGTCFRINSFIVE